VYTWGESLDSTSAVPGIRPQVKCGIASNACALCKGYASAQLRSIVAFRGLSVSWWVTGKWPYRPVFRALLLY